MINSVYKELQLEFKNKIDDSEELFYQFCHKYIIDNVSDSDILDVLNRKNRKIDNISILDYLENKRILLRAIKVLTLLELSKDFKEFQKYNKNIKADKTINSTDLIEFDKILFAITKVSKE